MNPGSPGYRPPTMSRKNASGGRSRREPRDRTGWMLTLGVEALRVRHARGRRGLRDDTREVEYRPPWRDSWPFRSASSGRRSPRCSKSISTRRGPPVGTRVRVAVCPGAGFRGPLAYASNSIFTSSPHRGASAHLVGNVALSRRARAGIGVTVRLYGRLSLRMDPIKRSVYCRQWCCRRDNGRYF